MKTRVPDPPIKCRDCGVSSTEATFAGSERNFQRCVPCAKAYNRKLYHSSNKRVCTEYREKKRVERRKEVEALKKEIFEKASLIKNKPMSEKEWIEAVAFFKGCAFCVTEEIEMRHILVPFDKGGKYTAWNVVPSCFKCHKKMGLKEYSPFYYLGPKTWSRQHREFFGEEAKERILKWIRKKLEEGEKLE